MAVPTRIKSMCLGEPQPERVDMQAKKSNNLRGISQFQSLKKLPQEIHEGFQNLTYKGLSFTFL